MKTPHAHRWHTFTARAALGACAVALLLASSPASAARTAHPEARADADGQLARTFYNPIVDNYADPWMTQWKGRYLLTVTTGDNVTIWEAHSITNISSGRSVIAWAPSGKQADFQDVWSPELRHFGDRWYVYFAADRNGNNATHRDYVLESDGDNPMGTYRFVGEIHDPANQWMIDPNVLDFHGHLYLIWSGWLSDQNQVQRLFIAPMNSPTHIDGAGVVISSPLFPWETSRAAINEGPVSLQHDGHTFIIYSANASWTNDYNLGMLTLRGTNPLDPHDWVKDPNPVFASANGVYGPGRASFVTSPNGKQWWMVYNAARFDHAGWNRTIRAQPFTWNKNGTPHLGAPIALDTALPLPAGEAPNRVTYKPIERTKAYVAFRVKVPSGGTYGLYIRYLNGSPVTAIQNFTIDGRPQLSLSFPETETFPGKSNLYSTMETDVTLPTGTSLLKIAQGPLAARIPMIQLTTRRVSG
ncbi:MAG: family 43 glycosylhydrolase [Firmicutes bacterium]|nr:family 43 glycosylhydrolase [Bacillota bacterium]